MAIRQVNTYEEQLNLWLAGESVHVTVTGRLGTPEGVRMGKESPSGDSSASDYECCPDFSCCYPKLLASLEERQRYAAFTQSQRNPDAEERSKERLLMTFLDRLVKKECPGEKVRIIG